MANAALENGVFELKLKAARGPDAAFGRKSTAEHGAAVRKSRAAKAALDQFRDREHAVEGAFLYSTRAPSIQACERRII